MTGRLDGASLVAGVRPLFSARPSSPDRDAPSRRFRVDPAGPGSRRLPGSRPESGEARDGAAVSAFSQSKEGNVTDREAYDEIREVMDIVAADPIFRGAARRRFLEALEIHQCALAAFIRIARSMELVEALP